MRPVLTCLLLFLCALQALPASASRGENLLTDGGFDALPGTPQSPWILSGEGSAEVGGSGYLPFDSEYVPSVRLVTSGPVGVQLAQCIPVSLASGTLLSFSAYTHGGTGIEREISLQTFASGNCSGSPLDEQVRDHHSNVPPLAFGFLYYIDPFLPSPAARSVRAVIHTRSGDPAVELKTSWDNARLVALHDLAGAPVTTRYWHQDMDGMPDEGEAGDAFGSAVAVGDFNNDGFDDLAIGVPGEDRVAFGVTYVDAGIVQVLYGNPHGLAIFDTQVLGALPFLGLQAGAGVGAALAAGDFDRDGYDDLAVGAPGSNDGTAIEAGAIYLSYGSEAGLAGFERITQASPRIGNNSESGDRFGFSLAVGHVNGDYRAELAIGAPGESVGGSGADTGAVYVLFGAEDGLQGAEAPAGPQVITQDGLPYGLQAGAQFGYAVEFHDLNGLRGEDLVVGAPFLDYPVDNAGIVFVLQSDHSQIDTAMVATFTPQAFGENPVPVNMFFGSALARSGHVGGELLRSDLLIGASGASTGATLGHGRAYRHTYRANSPDLESIDQGPPPEAAEAFDQFGAVMLSADLDGDGVANEVLIGAPGEDGDAGALMLGGINVHAARMLRQSDLGGLHEAGDRFGAALARGNFNGRGADELVVGIPGEALGSTTAAGAVVEIGWDEPAPRIFGHGFEDALP